MRLTEAEILRISRNYDLTTVFRLNLKGKPFNEVSELSICSALRELSVDGLGLTTLDSIKDLTELELLTAVDNDLNALPSLAKCYKLQTLILSNNPRLTLDSIVQAVSGLEQLHTLYLGTPEPPSQDAIAALLSACNSLRCVNGQRIQVVRRDPISREVFEAYAIAEPPIAPPRIPVDELFPPKPWTTDNDWEVPDAIVQAENDLFDGLDVKLETELSEI